MHRALAEAVVLFARGIATSNRPEDRVLGERYLSRLAPLLADAVLGRDILRELDGIERLFGNTWLVDESPFLPALVKWRQFRDEYEQFALGPMTINERLAALDLVAAFDSARARHSSAEMTSLLRRIRVDDGTIAAIVASGQGTG